jgi:hypothetical protein
VVVAFSSLTWELLRRGVFISSYVSVNPLVTDFYLKPFMTLTDVSDLERVLF